MNNKVAAISKMMELTSHASWRVNFDFAETNGQRQELGDCDLCFDFAHFIVKLYNT